MRGRGRGTRGRGDRGGRGGAFGERGGRGRGGGRGDFRSMPTAEAGRQVEEISRSFSIGASKISGSFDSPDRPTYGSGSIGTQAPFAVNYYELLCQLNEAIQYSVEIQCDYNQGFESVIVEKVAQRENWPPGWIFDGRNALFTAGQMLPAEEREFDVEIEQRRGTTYKMKMVQTATIPMNSIERYIKKEANIFPAEAVRVLEVLLGHAVSLIPNCMLHRKSVFFDNPANRCDIGHGAEAWLGYHQSVRPCQNGLFMNMDTSCTPFQKPLQVTEFMREILGLPRIPSHLSDQDIKIMQSVMKDLMVSLVRGRDKKKVVRIWNKPADCIFEHKQFGEISVLEYYSRVDSPIRYPDLPCLDCSKGRRLCYVPPEFASVAHGQYVRKINERHQEQMIRFAVQKPEEKEEYLSNLVRGSANINNFRKVPDFNLSMASPEMKQVRGRILPSPFLQYKEEQECLDVGTDGQWNLANINVTFFKATRLKSWAVVSLADAHSVNIPGENGLEAFVRELYDMLKKYRVLRDRTDLPNPPVVFSEGNLTRALETAAERARERYQQEPDIILCLLPRRNTRMYKSIKRISDTQMGIPTQCFVADKAMIGGNRQPRGRPQYCANLALKINVKVGGTNSILLSSAVCGLPMVSRRTPFAVLGADVSHPAVGSKIPSIAAVVGSLDPAAARYASRISMQEARTEIVQDMKDSAKGLLLEFYQANSQRRPEMIIVFRDGVSEGFFGQVLTHEYKAIREACREMGDPDADYTPPITYITIQKRHHTRLFPKGPAARHRSGNVKPGTIVDTEITSPFGHDFFLCSQAGIQGTVRPAHYHVLVDENNFGANAIQVMCYWMCYMQCRCTKSISVPSPANYAHLAALRARTIAGEETDDETSSVASEGMTTGGVTVGPNFGRSQSKMYYV